MAGADGAQSADGRASMDVKVTEQIEQFVARRFVGEKRTACVVDGLGRDKDDRGGIHMQREAPRQQLVRLVRKRECPGGGDSRVEVFRIARPTCMGEMRGSLNSRRTFTSVESKGDRS